MKDKPNEWVSVADLMSGVMAVVMLLLVVSVLQRTVAEISQKQSTEKKIKYIFKNMDSSYDKYNIRNLVSFDTVALKVTFKDAIFERGSAIVAPNVQSAFVHTQEKIQEFLEIEPRGRIYVEGHTDIVPVLRPVIDKAKYGAVYDDNYTLSAARAREARKYLIGNLSEESAQRIVVAGYGPSKLLDPANPKDACNRRVEIRFKVEE
jgi:chemotaxis protein MotB